ncbi:hypothetical protein FKP32DRAFT_1588101, partial [Trametes sanguinea]
MDLVNAIPTDLLEKLLEVRLTCLIDYRQRAQDATRDRTIYHSSAAAERVAQLEARAKMSDGFALRLELASRHLGGWSTEGRPCVEGALWFLGPVFNLQMDDFCDEVLSGTKPLPQMALEADRIMAHSLAAYAYFLKYKASVDELANIAKDAEEYPRPDDQQNVVDRLENILRGVWHANCAASMQFITPAVLMAGYAFRDLAQHLPIDVHRDIKHYRPLWRALAMRDKELIAEGRLRLNASEASPKEDVCASSYCVRKARKFKVEEEATASLKPCDGDCPTDLKPSYCSEICRKLDWKRHRLICMPRDEIIPPSDIALDSRTGYRVLRTLVPQGPIQQIEILPADEPGDNEQCGCVVSTAVLPSPFDDDELSRWVWKRY